MSNTVKEKFDKTMEISDKSRKIKEIAAGLGADLCGIASPDSSTAPLKVTTP